MKKSLLFCFFLFMVAFGLTSCVEPNKESDFKGQQTFVSVRVKLNGPPNRSFNNNPGNFKISTLPENTETALIVAVSAETDFKDGYNQIDPFFDKNLLDLDDSTVVLELPLNTPIRLFEYTFNQAFSLAELAESDRLVISSSVVDTFTLTEATTTLELYSSLGIAASPESIVISPASTNLKVGQTKQYSATAYYKEGNPQDLTALLNWSSSDSSLAEITDSVDSKGLATGKGSGIIVITATDGKVTAESALMVGSRPTAAPNTVSTNEDVDRIFAAGDFNFTDEDSGDTLSGVVITTLENNGRLYLDANSNGQVDAGEEIETNQEIPANDLSKLKLKPGVDVSGASYATFNFKVFDGVLYSTDDYAMTVDVAAVDDLPFISTIPDREIWGPVQPLLVSFTMSDAETDSNSLTLAGVSSNQTLLPDAGIAFSGTGTSRSATISPTPGLTGDAQITISVSDGGQTSEMVFNLSVRDCVSTQGGELLAAATFGGADACVNTNNELIIGSGHTVSSDGTGSPFSSVRVLAGARLEITGGAISGDILLEGGILNLGGTAAVSGDIVVSNASVIEIDGVVSVALLTLSSDTTIDVVGGTLSVGDTLRTTSGSTVELAVSGDLSLTNIELRGSLDIDGVVSLAAGATLIVHENATFGAGSDLAFPDGLMVQTGATLSLNDADLATTVTFSGGRTIDGYLVLEGADSLIFSNPPLDQTVLDTQVSNNGTGTIDNLPSDTDLSSLTPDWDSDFFCQEIGGCLSLSDVLQKSVLAKGWFMETDIEGKTYSIHFRPDDVNDAMTSGKLYAREVYSGTHQWVTGSPFIYVGNYQYVTVNGSLDGVLARGGENMSFVTWYESGHLYHALYYSSDVVVNGWRRDNNDDLYIYFNQEMDTTGGQVDGLSPVPTTQWIDPTKFKIQLAGYTDGETLTLPTAGFPTPDGTFISQAVSYTISHFVVVDGKVLDSDNNPLSFAYVTSSLDGMYIGTDASGDFSLATLSPDPGVDYLIYIHGGCDVLGVQLSGLNPSGGQYVIDCFGGGPAPAQVDYLDYEASGLTYPTNAGDTWYLTSDVTVTWNPGSFSGKISIYLLYDDSSSLNETDPQLLANDVNNRYWRKKFENVSNSGSLTFDLSRFGDQGLGFRLLLVDELGNWDISDNDFSIDMVDAANYRPAGLTSPNAGTEVWTYGTAETITWDDSLVTGDRVSIFILEDDPAGLDATVDLDLFVNDKYWHESIEDALNNGQFEVDPLYLGSNGSSSRILIVDSAGNWDICDNDFTINRVISGSYKPDGLISPNGGENWDPGTGETIIWDSNLIDTGWVSFYILRDDATDLDKTNPSLADVVNGRKWEQRFSEEAGQGSIDIDPLFFGGNGGSSRILIIDESGNWDIGDANFNVNDQYYGPPTDLSNLVPQADSDYFCNNGCSNLSDAIRMSAAGKGWFMETDINGKTFSVNFQPDDPNNVLNGGKLLGREIDISDHNWIQGSSFVTIGEYEYVVVNGSIDGVLAKGGRDLSVVTWFESGHLYHAGYFSEDAYVAGHLLETNQDLYVFFNRNMSSAGQVDGLSPVPAFEWIDSRTFKIQLGGYSDDETLTLPAASFQQTDATPLLQDWTYTISHFVTVDGTVVDSSSDPVNYAHISSSLDDLATGTNTSGDFSLATASLDPGTEYLIYVDMGCQTVGYQLSGLHPTGEQFVVDCAGGSPLVVDSAKYAVGAVTHPTASALAWTYASSETVTWNPASYSGPVSIYLLNDDSSGLDETDPALRASNVNSRYWTKRYADIANNGSLTINVSRLREQGQGFRILIVDQNGNWDISDNDFSIQLVEGSYYQATGVTSPNDGTEIWYYRFPETITWDELLFSGRISLFVLDDVSTDLNETDPNLLSDNVNVKKWSPISDVVFNTGQHPVNPEHLAAGVTGLRILLIDEDGNWDISDNDFVVNRVTAGGYRADAITSPSDGEIWTEGTTETLVWDTVLIDSGWISIFVLSDDSMGLDYSNPNLVDAVNSKMWEHRRSEDTAVGSLDLDPSDLGGNGSASRILIIDDSGNWDIVDSDFTISP